MHVIGRRLRALFRRRELERDMDDEMRLHLELETADLVRGGLPPHEAHRRARVAFGGVDRFKEEGRDARGVRWTEDLLRDARNGVRQLRRSPAFTVAALLTLALGIGATTAMYSMTRAVIFEPLPFDNSDQLVMIEQCRRCQRMAIGNYVTVRDETQTLSAVAALGSWSPIVRGPERSEVLEGTRVSVELFTMTGVAPLVGRRFAPADTAAGQSTVVMLSEAAWRTRYGADSAIVGRVLTVDGKPATVIGVVPTRYAFPETTDIWSLLVIDAKARADRSWTDYNILGRLRPGSSITDVSAELQAIGARLAIAFPDVMRRQQFTVRPSSAWNEQIRFHTVIFLSAVAFVLAIACTNLAGLLLARLTSREREIAVRAAMGAGGGRIARQLLAETLVLSLSGGILGTLAAWLLLEALRAGVPADVITGWVGVRLRWSAFGVALGLGGLTGALIGVGPAIRFSRPNLLQALKEGVRSAGGGSGARVRCVLVAAEIALSIVLLAAAALLTRTAVNLYRSDPGFSTDHVLTMRLRYPPRADTARPRPADLHDRLTSEIDKLPGVVRSATVAFVPFTGFTSSGFEIEGRTPTEKSDRPSARMQAVTAGYFDVMRIPVVRGRQLVPSDDAAAPRVVLMNESAARRLFLERGEEPIGRAILLDSVRYEIVGVTRDVYHQGVNRGVWYEIYYPQSQRPRSAVDLVVRTSGDPAAMAASVTRAVAAFDHDLAINRVRPMSVVASEFLQQYRIMAGIMLTFAGIALAISAIGLYGVISYAVAQRTREFGIRLALGADERELRRLVLGDGARLTAVGVAIGVFGAVGLTRVMRSLLYGVGPADPMMLGAIAIALGVLALGASMVPARRAASVDPMTSLRSE